MQRILISVIMLCRAMFRKRLMWQLEDRWDGHESGVRTCVATQDEHAEKKCWGRRHAEASVRVSHLQDRTLVKVNVFRS